MPKASDKTVEVHTFGKERIEVIFKKANPRSKSNPPDKFPDLAPGISIEHGIRCERDVAVKLRDGTIIYTDVYRPEGGTNLPAIIAWSPYGKRVGYNPKTPAPHGVPLGAVSCMAKHEGPDPAYWCQHGYAVLNPDVRGAGNSQGDIMFFDSTDRRDGYDFIEWVAAQKWCNGKVGMSGNSWLAMSQWFIATEQPPHLAAIAPWEGVTDCYRDWAHFGGIPQTGFSENLINGLCGPGRVEYMPDMILKYPLMNAYWEDKIVRFENIKVPAYVVASWTNPLHTHGTLNAFRHIASTNKWLRVHNTHEWNDYYKPQNLDDLRRFFDRYLKDIHNGWEYTPIVRLSVLNVGGTDEVNRPETEWPLARTKYEKLYLDAKNMTLSPRPSRNESEVRYTPDATGQASFTMTFNEDTELTGYMKLHLWVEADGGNDMDLFVYICKLDISGKLIRLPMMGYTEQGVIEPIRISLGVAGQLRVSHREFDPKRSSASEPYLSHGRELLLKPKEVVPVEIGIWPAGLFWHAGQQLCVIVRGQSQSYEDDIIPARKIFKYHYRNRGQHIIHTGGKYDSHLLVPKIPK